MKPKVLFVTPTLGEKEACGVGLYGKLWTDVLIKLEKYDFNVLYSDSTIETYETIKNLSPEVVFYMWHGNVNTWMGDPIFRNNFPNIKHVAILFDVQQREVDLFNPILHSGGIPYALVPNPTIFGNKRVFVTNKLLPPSPTIDYVESSIPIIGFQGFAFSHKGIARLSKIVNEEFDECIFRLHMPPSWYMDRDGYHINERINEVSNIIKKPNIRVEFSHHMMNTQELVNWLSQNTINCYLYNYPSPAGLASAPDYALSAKRPIAVSNNHMLKNFFHCSPSVVVNEPHTLKEIISNGTKPLEILYNSYSENNFLNDWEKAINHFISI